MHNTIKDDEITSSTPQTPKTPTQSTFIGLQSTPNSSSITTPSKSSKKARAIGSTQKHFLEPSLQSKAKRRKVIGDTTEIEECSTSSSWAELSSNIIGSWQVFPVNLVTRQIFTLRYLAPLGEYQEVYIS